MRSRRSAALVLAMAGITLAALSAVTVGSAAPEGSAVKGAIITDTAGLNDKSFNFLANKGRLRAQKELKIETRAYISANESE